jgi:hypothetical protein
MRFRWPPRLGLAFPRSVPAPHSDVRGRKRPSATVAYRTSSKSIIRNLRDVFGENDPARRRAAIDELWAEDGVFYDPSKGAIRGRDEIDRVAGAVKATHPDFRYQVTAAPQEYCDAGMVPWISGRPGEVPAYLRREHWFLV